MFCVHLKLSTSNLQARVVVMNKGELFEADVAFKIRSFFTENFSKGQKDLLAARIW